MFEQFPKKRKELSQELQKIYEQYYYTNRNGKSPASFMSQYMESWLHKKVAEDIPSLKLHDKSFSTLEIGAGTLNQLAYEEKIGDYDIVEPFEHLYSTSKDRPLIDHIYRDISEIPDNVHYDRITAIASFEHICNLPEVVALCGLKLKEGGTLRVSIPSEGTALWKLGWMLTTGLEFRLRYRESYQKIIDHEHVNTSHEIETVLCHFFNISKHHVFGLCKNLSLYQYLECTNPNIDYCKEYLTTKKSLL